MKHNMGPFSLQTDSPEEMHGWIRDIQMKIQDFRGPSKVTLSSEMDNSLLLAKSYWEKSVNPCLRVTAGMLLSL